MRVSNFRTFSFEVGILYEGARTKPQMESAYQALLKFSEFDGAKKISTREGKTKAKLTSSDNSLSLTLGENGISLIYVNTKLEAVRSEKLKSACELARKAHGQLPDELPIEKVRTRHLFYSLNKRDRDHLVKEVVNNKFMDNLEDFQISLALEVDHATGAPEMTSLDITVQHTTKMHTVFEDNNRHDDLERVITLYDESEISDGPDAGEVDAFMKFIVDYQSSFKSLGRLGYETGARG